ncbi:MAG: efflux RND transporter permease subunit [Bdellovibrionales bacterium]|nr:efflux RND transporter permease subunit [Bdellovibrionales bacterium]
MFLGKLPEFGVNNKLIVNLFSVFIVLAAIFTYKTIKREAFPNFSFDIVTISTVYPGATPEEIETLITQPIEDEIKAVSDIKETLSVSTEGYSLIYITLDPDTKNKSRVVNDIQQAVNKVDDLPPNLEKLPIVTELRTQDSPIIEVTLSGKLTRQEIQDLALKLETQLEELDEVSTIVRNGWKEKQIWVELDPEKLHHYKISADTVARAVQLRNVNIPGGKIYGKNFETLLRTNTEYKTVEEIDDIVVRSNTTGQIVRVRDVGKSSYQFQDQATSLRVDGSSAVGLVVVKKERYDIIKLVDKVSKTVDRFSAQAPKELHIAYVNDISFFVKRRLGILTNNGTVGLIFVLLALFIFLSPPIAFWTVIGLPVAAGTGLWVMKYFGISINLISMFGLIMVLGMLVDDAIIVAENIYRKMEEGLDLKLAAIEGTKEVIKPVSTAIMTSILVFLPLSMMTGIFGKFVFAIPVVVIIMLLASWIESMWILPSHLTEFPNITKRFLGKATANKSTSIITPLKKYYEIFLQKILPLHTPVTFLTFFLIVIGIYWGIKTTPVNLFPGEGIEIFFIRGESEIGTPLEITQQKFVELEKIVAELPKEEVKNYVTVSGKIENDPNDPFNIRGSHVGQMIVYLTPEQDRERTAKEITQELRPKLEAFSRFEKLTIEEVNPGPPQGRPVAVRIRGESYEILDEIAEKVKHELSLISGVYDIRDDLEDGKKELNIIVDEKVLAQTGLTPTSVANSVRTAYEGFLAAIIQEGEEETNVLVRLHQAARSSSEALSKLFVENTRGYQIPLSKIVSLEEGVGYNSMKHYKGKRTVSVTSEIDEEKTTSMEVNQMLQQKIENIEKDYLGYSISYGGEYEETNESLGSLLRAFVLSIFLIFIILASTFNTLTQPFLIMLAIPFSLFSAIYALKFHGEPFSFLAMIGMIGLSGVSVNDSIVLIDFINEKRKEYSDALEGVIEACKIRLRPVLLTSITTVVGLIPVAYGIGGGDPFLMPMALAMAWGLAFGTILILFLIPNAYLTMKKYPLGSIAGLFSPLIAIGMIQSPLSKVLPTKVGGIMLVEVLAFSMMMAIPFFIVGVKRFALFIFDKMMNLVSRIF